MRTVEAVSEGRANNFDAIRFFAASFVILAHAYPLAGEASPFLILPDYDIGRGAVTVFFGISVLLIVKSVLRTRLIIEFGTAWYLRVMPDLALVLALSALFLGPIVSTLSLKSYFHQKMVWTYIAHNLSLWNMRYALPGVFEGNPFANSVNGSIWTLPYEVICYIAAAGLGLLGLLTRRGAVLPLLIYATAYVALRGGWAAAPAQWAELTFPSLSGERCTFGGGSFYFLGWRSPLWSGWFGSYGKLRWLAKCWS